MPLARIVLDVPAQLQARFSGQKNIRENQIGIDVGQPQQSGLAIRQADNFKAFLAQDAFAHPLSVRAVVRQQDAAHQGWLGGLGGFDG